MKTFLTIALFTVSFAAFSQTNSKLVELYGLNYSTAFFPESTPKVELTGIRWVFNKTISYVVVNEYRPILLKDMEREFKKFPHLTQTSYLGNTVFITTKLPETEAGKQKIINDPNYHLFIFYPCIVDSQKVFIPLKIHASVLFNEKPTQIL